MSAALRRSGLLLVLIVAHVSGLQAATKAAAGAKPAAPAAATPRSAAPIDLSGYWVAIIDTDWLWRMVTPAKGDFNMLPLTSAAKQLGNSWDPAADEAAGEQCKAYGAPGLMRIPGRLHISWRDDNTLEVDTDAGKQTRLLRFGAPDTQSALQAPSLQGESAASWDIARGSAAPGADGPRYGSLHMVTTHLRAGYLRKNGVPYSADAVLSEDWDVMKEPDGNVWLVIETQVADPLYLQRPWLTSLVFKRERDGSKWNPTPCTVK